MQTFKVFDSSGMWLINTGKFTFQDPESGARFEPNIPTQAQHTEWVKAQEAVIKPWSKPEAEAAEDAEAEAEAAEDAEAEAAKAKAEAAKKIK